MSSTSELNEKTTNCASRNSAIGCSFVFVFLLLVLSPSGRAKPDNRNFFFKESTTKFSTVMSELLVKFHYCIISCFTKKGKTNYQTLPFPRKWNSLKHNSFPIGGGGEGNAHGTDHAKFYHLRIWLHVNVCLK